MTTETKPGAKSKPSRKPTKRREQQRAIETRQAILDAALAEFAEKGFEAASIRNIGERTGFQHPLITYHFKTKELLWKAVADHVFSRVKDDWEDKRLADPRMSPLERLREEYRAFLTFTMDYPNFHHFMLRENRPGSNRLPWLVETYLVPLMGRILPHIEEAQAAGLLPQVDPVIFHYMMIGIMSVPSSIGAEMKLAKGISPSDPAVLSQYWNLIDTLIFRLPPGSAAEPPFVKRPARARSARPQKASAKKSGAVAQPRKRAKPAEA